MATDNRTIGWGWVGLILVVGLIGAGFLYQREGGRLFGSKELAEGAAPHREQHGSEVQPGANGTVKSEPAAAQVADSKTSSSASPSNATPVPSNANSQAVGGTRPSRSTPGTLNVWFGGGGNPGPWLYIDEKLVRNYSTRPHVQGDPFWNEGHSDSVTVQPGRHKVQLVYLNSNKRVSPSMLAATEPFFVQIEPGGIVSVGNGVFNVGGIVLPFSHELSVLEAVVGHPTLNVHGTLVSPMNPRKWLDGWAVWVDAQSVLLESDPVFTALRKLHAEFKQRKPSRKIVKLDLPEKHGGPREVDGSQIKVLIFELKRQFFGEWPVKVISIREDDPAKNAELLQTEGLHKRLNDAVQQKINALDDLNGIARMLDEAGN